MPWHRPVLNLPERVSGAARDLLVKLLQAEGVPVRVSLTKPFFGYLPDARGKWSKNDFPNTTKLLDAMFYVSEIAPPAD
ncbi:hypothetical protein SAMCCGM7_pB0117 (plasmid) [Sinorhizobium americanum CCGM7]|nr:hypothetical protein SAMCCGM7_pB0117 [Sinorhizobium americanum CCGM7]